MITKRDIAVALIISAGSLGVSIGVIGIKNFFITALFFIIPLIITLVLFFIFKPKTSGPVYDKRWDY